MATGRSQNNLGLLVHCCHSSLLHYHNTLRHTCIHYSLNIHRLGSAIEIVALALQSNKPGHPGHSLVGTDSVETFRSTRMTSSSWLLPTIQTSGRGLGTRLSRTRSIETCWMCVAYCSGHLNVTVLSLSCGYGACITGYMSDPALL